MKREIRLNADGLYEEHLHMEDAHNSVRILIQNTDESFDKFHQRCEERFVQVQEIENFKNIPVLERYASLPEQSDTVVQYYRTTSSFNNQQEL